LLTTALFRKSGINTVSSSKGLQSSLKISDQKLEILWQDAMTYKRGDSTVIEVPITSQGIFNFDTKVRTEGEKIAVNKSFTRVLFIITKAKTEGYFMTIINSDGYLANASSNPKKNTFLKKEANFSGTIVYHDLSGKMTNAITIGNMLIPGKESSLKSPSSNKVSSALPESCIETPIYEVIGVGCTDISANFTYCESVYSVYIGTTICGNGGSPNPNPNSPGGTGGNNTNQREIKLDATITTNPKLYCLLKKLLGLDGTSGNAQMKDLLAAFNNQGFDVTFKIGQTKPDSKGEASADPSNPTKYNIVLNSAKINTETQMSWVKTLLHEAFHVNLMQKSYEMFGAAAVAMWPKKIESMSMAELSDYMGMLAFNSSNPILVSQHHEFMAENFEVIKDGLKSFSLANNPNHNDYNNYHFDALAYEGIHESSYYKNTIIKNADGSLKTVEINGHQLILQDVHQNFYLSIKDQNIPCN
jgi:hypothetical protein